MISLGLGTAKNATSPLQRPRALDFLELDSI